MACRMKKLLLLWALVVVALSGCVEEKPSPEELKAMMIDSVEKMETAAFAVDADQAIKLVNPQETNKSLRTINFETRSVGEGAMNLSARTMKMTMTTTTSTDDVKDVVTEMEMYMINDTMYTKVDGNWTRMPGMPEETWDQQNQVKNQAELLNASEIEFIGSEKVDGVDAYKVKVVPDMETFAMILSQQVGSVPLYAMNVTEIFEGGEMEWTAWIAKDSGLPLKNLIMLDLTITSEMMNIPAGEMDEIEMTIRSDTTVICSRFNEPIVIEVPEEALTAPSWLDLLMAMISQPPEEADVEQ